MRRRTPNPSYGTRAWLWLAIAALFALVHSTAGVVGCVILVSLNARWADEDRRR